MTYLQKSHNLSSKLQNNLVCLRKYHMVKSPWFPRCINIITLQANMTYQSGSVYNIQTYQ